MLIGVCGGLCAGKHEIATYLVKNYNFTAIKIVPPPSHDITSGVDHVGIKEHYEGRRLRSSSTLQTLPEHVFPNAESLIDFVVRRWREPFVTTDIWDEAVLDAPYKRPFFMLVSVDAPVHIRWKRFTARCKEQHKPTMTLEQFVLTSDAHMYHPTLGLAAVISRATLRLINPTSSLGTLHHILTTLNLPNHERLRPSWDAYFMHLASLAAQRSNCVKRRVGCVLVREKRVISTGYNGTARQLVNCNEGGYGRCNSVTTVGVGLSTCLCIHAEENALLEAGRERVGGGAILYCDTCPCLTCSIKIVQVGVVEVVYSEGYSMDNETAAVLKEGGVRLRQYSPPRDGLVYLDESHLDRTVITNTPNDQINQINQNSSCTPGTV